MNSKKQIDTEKLLYKLILQFSIYTRGTNEQLDPHLLNISQLLKQGAHYQQLSSELNALSKTLAHLSRFENQVESVTTSSDKGQQKYFISRLKKLLIETDIPLKFQRQYIHLKKRITGDIDSTAFNKIIDITLSLLLDLKDYVIEEQKDIEIFLVDISKHLDVLEMHVNNASTSNKKSIENRTNLHNVIDLHVDSIINNSANATELSSLQKNINHSLQELTYQLHNHKETEDSRQLQSQKQLKQMSDKLQEMEIEAESLRNNLKIAHDNALRDPLTGLPNRLAYDERIILETSRWQRYKNPLTLIIWDIDLFKLINDNFGHKAGDKTLSLVAQLIFNNCRKSDFIARYGGEEFVMLLPNTSSNQAYGLAEKIRLSIANSGFNHSGKLINITISAGISQFSESDSHEHVFERADKGLYSSKEQGRNKCSINNK